jgi:tol-pal system protein YbgF
MLTMSQTPSLHGFTARARSVVLALCAGGLLALAAPANAQVFGGSGYVPAPDPVMQRLQDRIESLEESLKASTGKAESLAFELNQAKQSADRANAAQQQMAQQLAAVTARLETLERMVVGDTGGSGAVALAPPPGQGGPVALTPTSGQQTPALQSRFDTASLPADEAEHVKQVRQYLLNGEFPSAQAAASAYLERYPKGPNASEAQYLLGEAYLYQEAYSEAAAAYGKLLSAYPKAAKGPEGLVKLARSMRLMGQKEQACKALGLMPRQFPNASQAAKTLADAEKSRSGC